ncbi:MAG TPA: PDZ domain-containing protein, partial [Longimicrobiales bacterium]|nr:PDZ domain-containing protein [Longimicrobiales bacterium]
ARIGVTVSGQQHARWDRDGAHVESVLEGGPADEAGLLEGDVIVRVNGHSLFDPLDDQEDEDDIDLDQSVPVQRLLALLGDVEPGDEVEIEYLRDGETRRAVLEAEENPAGFGRGLAVLDQVGPGIVWNRGGDVRAFSFPEEGRAWRFNLPEGRFDFDLDFPEGMRYLRMDTLRSEGGELGELLAGSRDPCFTRGSGASSGGSVWIFGGNCVDGLELTEVNPELGEYFGTDEGLLVTEVREGSTLGLRAGDVLLAVDGREVEDVGHARRILQSYRPDEELTLRIMRSGEAMEVTGRRR